MRNNQCCRELSSWSLIKLYILVFFNHKIQIHSSSSSLMSGRWVLIYVHSIYYPWSCDIGLPRGALPVIAFGLHVPGRPSWLWFQINWILRHLWYLGLTFHDHFYHLGFIKIKFAITLSRFRCYLEVLKWVNYN